MALVTQGDGQDNVQKREQKIDGRPCKPISGYKQRKGV